MQTGENSYGIPPEWLINPVAKAEEGELSNMWSSVPKINGLSEKMSWVKAVQNKAQGMNIACRYHKETVPGDDKEHEYLVFSTDANMIASLEKMGYKQFPTWLKRQREQEPGIVLLDKLVIDITDIDRHNYFAKNSYIMRYVQNMAIVKMAFENEGYPVPDHVSNYVVSCIWECDQMRSHPDVPRDLKERYENVYKVTVANFAQSYATKYTLDTLPKNRDHHVKETYFRDNHIPVIWDVIDERCYQYLQQELKAGKYPEFIFYRTSNPFLKFKNLAKEYDKIAKHKDVSSLGPNFWEKDIGSKQFHICFPLSQQDMYYNMLNEYNTRNLKSRVSLDELKKSSKYPLELTYLHLYDMPNWDVLCSTGVPWALNDGTYGQCNPITPKSTSLEIPVLYRYEDMHRVEHFINRLTREMRDYVPMSDKSRQEARNPKPTNATLSRLMARKEKRQKSQDVSLDL